VLDNDKRKLLILRPYQIHAIEAMRAASKQGKSGFIWHTTGSGKTMTSYKATRNLLMDIPSIEKTVFLIDRKDLDMQTKMAFQSYADNDTIEVDDTDYVDSLIQKMSDDNRQMIVTTRQKMQIMVNRRLKEGTKRYEKMKSLKVAFVVDECHRAVTPQTKRDLETFFTNSLWYGFTGTPIFDENSYERKGDLPQTTEQMYGECLHSYTIKEAIHDEAVLGFMVENLGAKDLSDDEAKKVYETEEHMRKVLNVILNQSYDKFGMNNDKGRTYEAILTTGSIERAQKYYDLLKKVKEGKDKLKICDTVHKALPDFPKFAITYSLSENEEASTINQNKMKEALKDYQEMFGTSYQIDAINAYNNNLNERLARKEKKYLDRSQQLDLVIVVDRLLTGFDAPCLSTLFIDRQPMAPQNIIQAFSRTNRLFDYAKLYGQIVTFQAPREYKDAINKALRLYSRGGDGKPIAEDWDDVKTSFSVSLKAIRNLAQTPEDIAGLSRKQKKAFIHLFRALDHDFAHLKSFSVYQPCVLDSLGFSEEEYENYAAMYKNVMEELKKPDDNQNPDEEPVWDDYDLVAYSKLRIDFEYIVELLRGVMESFEQSQDDFNKAEFETRIRTIKEIITEFAGDNPKLSALLMQVVNGIEKNKERFLGQDISVIINQMRYAVIDEEIKKYAEKWYLDFEDVKYEVLHFRDGELANENKLKDSADYGAYKEENEDALSKLKFRIRMIDEFKNDLMPEIAPLVD
ncbi:MAG: type I restriction endonuclease subunit R, partial [Hungatella sp.]|nr:type I restriction endonuclease subunit R [Hungatella sp.]